MDVWCAIRTYPKHAQELGNPIPQEPVFFLKPTSCVTAFGEIDACDGDVHHEIELVIRLDSELKPHKMALGLDLTKRSIQDRLKLNSLPWAEAKAFKGAAVIGEWVNFDSNARYTLEKNGTMVQSGSLREMSWTVEELLQKLQGWAEMKEGDVLFTGTPSGVGPLNKSDQLTASLYIGNELISSEKAVCL
jgi:2-keto-4-pentenoate hydratase/2-oxohepta-3-ene-1,7-dioic acid hydratase in catechol pathway